jgi:hypothetical protein
MSEPMSLEWFFRNLDKFDNNTAFSSLEGKSILALTSDFGKRASSNQLGGLGSPKIVISKNPIEKINELDSFVKSLDSKRFDFVFCERGHLPVGDTNNLLEPILGILQGLLASEGAIFLGLEKRPAIQGWYPSNPMSLYEGEWRPSESYLFDWDLRNWAVRRVLESKSADSSRFVVLRMVPKRPTILLICGESTSGKTTLAREFARLSPGTHVSNDFIYSQLVSRARKDIVDSSDSELLAQLGDGSGRASGDFNRSLEADSDLFRQYISHLLASIPRGRSLVTIDFDLRLQSSIKLLKETLEDEGFSVWVVTR